MGGKVDNKFIDLTPLKRDSRGILWAESIGTKLNFIYKDIKGEVTLVDYKKEKQRLIFDYDGELIDMASSSFVNCNFGNFLGTCTTKYKLEIGDIINGSLIIDKIKIKNGKKNGKGYLLKCLTHGYKHKTTEKMLIRGDRCPICTSRKVLKGVNDIATTHPHLIKYFLNVEDIYKYTYSSNKKLKLKCPDCGCEKEHAPNYISKRGFICPMCSDGYTYPEKFTLSFLKQLKLKAIPQLTRIDFSWCGDYRYDFFIENNSTIVETHGEQHYNEKCVFNRLYGSLKEQNENDKNKKELAMKNNIKHYIELDCRESELEWIKSSIMNSELTMLFDFKEEDIDWNKCHEFAINSRVKEVCDLWNKGIHSPYDIADITRISSGTCAKYLKQGTVLGWCNYDKSISMKYGGAKKRTSRNKEVLVYDKNWNELGSAISMTQMSELSHELLGIHIDRKLISHACNSKSHFSKGYYFKYKKEQGS